VLVLDHAHRRLTVHHCHPAPNAADLDLVERFAPPIQQAAESPEPPNDLFDTSGHGLVGVTKCVFGDSGSKAGTASIGWDDLGSVAELTLRRPGRDGVCSATKTARARAALRVVREEVSGSTARRARPCGYP